MSDPYIYCALIRAPGAGDDRRISGERTHAIFAAQLPFLPSFRSSDFLGAMAGSFRLKLLVERQIRFINDLAMMRGHDATFDLRFLSRRRTQASNAGRRILVYFAGKVVSPGADRQKATDLALDLWYRFRGCFPSEDPFNYPLEPIDKPWLQKAARESAQSSADLDATFQAQVLLPISLDGAATRISEVRKFEDRDDLVKAVVGRPEDAAYRATPQLGYLVHPFRPTLEASALSNVFEAMLAEPQDCLVRVSVRPTLLEDRELRQLSELLSEYQRQLEHTEGWVHLYKKEHYERMERAYRALLEAQRSLFRVAVQVVGEDRRPAAVVGAISSELLQNREGETLSVSEARPTPGGGDLEAIAENLWLLEHRRWGRTSGGSTLERMPLLATAVEAAGAFRLPIPPESGYMPGMEVRDEPFVRPPAGARTEDTIPIGEVLHRGLPSGVLHGITRRELNRHVLVAGSTGSGKTMTCLQVLSQAWARWRIPFLVLYPVGKPDYRLLMADPRVRDDLLLFTVGDKFSPFRFNPFDVPPRVLLGTHVSNMLRAFATTMYMWGPLPNLFRAALSRLYLDECGWERGDRRGDHDRQRIPSLSDFHRVLKELAGAWARGYRADLGADLQADSEVKIRTLLDTSGDVLDVREGPRPILQTVLEHPTVVELGRVGSAFDVALIVSFLVTLLGEHVAARASDAAEALTHVTVIEEAHRVMPGQVVVTGQHTADPRTGGAEDFAHVLSEVRGFGESIIIAEQTPTKLIPDAIANTQVKVMHWLEDHVSFAMFADIMNLNERQRHHVRTLRPGEVVMRAASGNPVLVRVRNYVDEVRDVRLARGEQGAVSLPSDVEVQAFMAAQARRLDLSLPVLCTRGDARPATGTDAPARVAPRPGGRDDAAADRAAATTPTDDARLDELLREAQRRRHAGTGGTP